MFNCDCGKAYKFASGLSKHKERCDGGGGGSGGGDNKATTSHCPPPSVVVDNVAGGGGGGRVSDDDDDITKSSFFTFPLTQLKPTANFSKEDLEMLEKRKQARLKAIQQSRIEEKQRNAAAAERKKREALISTSAGLYDNSSSSHFQENIGNEEHNASINIKYVRTSQETRQVIDAVAAAANEYCHNQGLGRNNHNSSNIEKDKSSIDGDGDGDGDDDVRSVGGGGGGALAPATSINSSGTTVFHHPSRTISIIEKDAGDDDMDESERIVTLEKMTYLVLALIQQNTKIQKENALLKAIISKIDPSKLE